MQARRRGGIISRWIGRALRSSGAGGRPGAAPDLCLVSRRECHLCDDMAAVLEEVLAPMGIAWRTVDVDTDEELLARFGDVVPVLLRDGRPMAKVRITRRQLERIVHRRR